MKNLIEVLRFKEQEISRVKREIDALRIAAQVLSDEGQPAKSQSGESRRTLEVQ
ncbi:MAG: hypothetical protein ACRD2U_17890 [Terriglobales bacterium]